MLDRQIQLRAAARTFDNATIERLVASGVNIQPDCNDALVVAVGVQNAEAVKLFIRVGVEVRCFNNRPFFLAVECGNHQIAQMLMSAGVNFSLLWFDPVELAVDNAHIEMIRWLLRKGAPFRVEATLATAVSHAIDLDPLRTKIPEKQRRACIEALLPPALHAGLLFQQARAVVDTVRRYKPCESTVVAWMAEYMVSHPPARKLQSAV